MKLECVLFVSLFFFIGGMSVHLQLLAMFEPILRVFNLKYVILLNKIICIVIFGFCVFVHSSHCVSIYAFFTSCFLHIRAF
jgi:hypothetical protein